MQALTSFLYLAPLLILQGGSSLSAFTLEQLQALASNSQTFRMDMRTASATRSPLNCFLLEFPSNESRFCWATKA
jgi:hypothetical protein